MLHLQIMITEWATGSISNIWLLTYLNTYAVMIQDVKELLERVLHQADRQKKCSNSERKKSCLQMSVNKLSI